MILNRRFELVAELGKGGQGTVFRARDQLLGREVAIKLVSWPADSRSYLQARFLREVRAAARLEHPHIARVYDVGPTAEGAFVAMELIRGASLREHATGTLAPGEALGLVAKLARALHYAHERGVVHRDMKPENVVLDEKGEPRIIDFGAAKDLLPGAVNITNPGSILGTIRYLSPEQARGENERVTASSDVWTLGALLHELLCGAPPFQAKGMAVLSEIENAEPPVLGEPGTPLRRASEVALRALRKRPEERFPTALALAAACEAEGAPTPPKIASGRRRPLVVAAVAAPLLAVAVGVALGSRSRPPAEPTPPVTPPAPPTTASVSVPSVVAPVTTVATSPLPMETAGFARSPGATLVAVCGSYGGKTVRGKGQVERVSQVAVTGAGRHIVALCGDQVVTWERATWREVSRSPKGATSFALARDGSRIVIAFGSSVTWVEIDGRVLGTVELGRPISGVALHPDDDHAVVDVGEEIVTWERGTGKTTLFSHMIGAATLTASREGGWLAVVRPQAIRLFGPQGATFVIRESASHVEMSADGASMLTVSTSGALRVWPTSGGEPRTCPVADVKLAGFEAGGRVFHITGRSGPAEAVAMGLWDPTTGATRDTGTVLNLNFIACACEPSARRAYLAYLNGVLEWDLERGKITWVSPILLDVDEIVAAESGARVLTRTHGTGVLFDTRDPASPKPIDFAPTKLFPGFAIAASGKTLAMRVTGPGEQVTILSEDSAIITLVGKLGEHPSVLSLSPDASHVAAGLDKGGMAVWDVRDRTPPVEKKVHRGAVTAIAVMPDLVLSGGDDGSIALSKLSNLEPRPAPPKLDSEVVALVASADGKRALAASRRGSVCIWELGSGSVVKTLSFAGGLDAFSAAPDLSRAYAAAEGSSAVTVLDLESGRTSVLVDLRSSHDIVRALSLCQGGRTLWVGTGRGVALRFALEP